MRPCTHRATTTALKLVKETLPRMALAGEQRAAERRGMESLLRARADAQLTLYSAPPPPAGAGAAALGSGRDVRKVLVAEGAFECRTCSRRFPSFRALGGHRTGHTRRHAPQQHHGPEHAEAGSKQARSHSHVCAVCGLEFPMGQALGGHMRRHRGEAPAPAEARVEQPEMIDLNCPPLEDRGGEQGVECPESEPRLLNLLV